MNRYEATGVCLIGAETAKVNTIAPHFGEGKHEAISNPVIAVDLTMP